MNDTTRTLVFVGVAGALAAAAFGMHAANQPVSLEEFSDVGEEFYPKFDNPREATGLRVAAYNEDAARVDVFNVEFKDGLWRIPSHHDYPADGEERLAKTATSIIGLQRGALASTSADDFKRLGVLDPLDETVTGTEGRGDRITLTKGDQTLVDYIIGNKVEDGPQNTYNVRRADENRTYRVTLDLDLSTKFADWIEPDLLDFRRGDVRELVIDRYSIDETRGMLVPGTQSELTRASQDGQWKLKGIDEQTQQVKVSTVNSMITALENLKIVGVRAKPAGLSADLRGEGDGAIDGLAVIDLTRKGFFLDSRGSLVSNEGDVRMATADGALYMLRFGEVFTGSDVEIEIGKSSVESKSKQEDNPDVSKEDASTKFDVDKSEDADDASPEDDEGDALKKSRYVFITAQFDESQIAALPEKPTKPKAPASLDDDKADKAADVGEKEKPPADEDSAAQDEAADDAPEKSVDEKPAGGDESEQDDSKADQPDPKAEYEQALADYGTKLKDWEARKTEREAKIEAGQKRVQELNDRFADWYYVISAATFDKIRVSPEDLVEPLKPAGNAAGTAMPGAARLTPPVVAPPAEKSPDKPVDNEKPAEDKPTSEKSDAAKPADGDQSDREKPADASTKPAEPSNDPSADDKPAADDTPQPEKPVEENSSSDES